MTEHTTQAGFDRFVTDGGQQCAADPEVFADTDRHEISLTEADLLGTHEYKRVLYTGRRVADLDSDRVAKKIGGERAFELQTEWLDSVFYNHDITGDMEWHTVFRKATESDDYKVEFDADYESGDLTITVGRT